MMQLPIFRNLRKNAIRLLESIESLKEGKVEVISLFELPKSNYFYSIKFLRCL